MTNAEKKERRVLRHKLQREAAKHLSLNARMSMTPAQIKAAGKRIVDMLFAGKNPALAVRLTS